MRSAACDPPLCRGRRLVRWLRGVEGVRAVRDEEPTTIAALERVLRRGGRVAGRAAVRHLDERIITDKVIGIYENVLAGHEESAGARLVSRTSQAGR